MRMSYRPASVPHLRQFLFPLVALMAICMPVTSTHAQSPSQLSGHVVNGSANSEALAATAVSVSILDGPNKKPVSTVMTDADGVYRVEGLEAGTNAIYVASVSYGGETFSSAPVSLIPGQIAQADVTVFNGGAPTNAVSIQR